MHLCMHLYVRLYASVLTTPNAVYFLLADHLHRMCAAPLCRDGDWSVVQIVNGLQKYSKIIIIIKTNMETKSTKLQISFSQISHRESPSPFLLAH